MTFLPIVERELRIRARLKSTYLFRVAGAVLALCVVGFMLVVSIGITSPDRFGAMIFQVLAWLALIYCILEGGRNTADCLSEEKRGGTLGLLFLTDLKGYDVVLGKMVATSLNSFYALLAVLPFLAMPLLLGGVTPGEFWRMALLLVNTLFLSLTIGLLVSALSRDERRAWSGTYGLIALIAFYPLLADALNFLPGKPWIYFGPSTAFQSFGDVFYRKHPGPYWTSVVYTNLLGWGLLLAASVALPRAWQERVMGKGGLGFRSRRKRTPVMGADPVTWLASRPHRQQGLLWVVGIGVALLALASAGTNFWGDLFWWALALHMIFVLWAAVQASFVFGEARASGALELLLATPLSVKEIVRGHFEGLRKMFQMPVVVLITVEMCLLVVYLFMANPSIRDPWEWLFKCFALAIPTIVLISLFILDLYAVAWFGLWMGLSSRKPSQALSKTILLVLVLPIVCGAPCNVLWPILGLIKDLIFISYARDQLHRRFRNIVTEQFALRHETERWTVVPNPAVPPQLP